MKKLLPILLISLVALWACDEENIALNDYIKDFIEQKYEGVRILYAEKDFNGEIEVEIVHDNKTKEVRFNRNNNWISTIWDLPISQLPDAARESVLSRYPEYRIDDVDYVEKPSGDCYKVEIEKGEWDRTVFVTADGEILN
ncbi:MAG: PepSY-like domain-containing protein [Bacteroidaceae bacterium]|nr:PepSY-like domain-containing protein [Bacteroidaceae bacterium]